MEKIRLSIFVTHGRKGIELLCDPWAWILYIFLCLNVSLRDCSKAEMDSLQDQKSAGGGGGVNWELAREHWLRKGQGEKNTGKYFRVVCMIVEFWFCDWTLKIIVRVVIIWISVWEMWEVIILCRSVHPMSHITWDLKQQGLVPFWLWKLHWDEELNLFVSASLNAIPISPSSLASFYSPMTHVEVQSPNPFSEVNGVSGHEKSEGGKGDMPWDTLKDIYWILWSEVMIYAMEKMTRDTTSQYIGIIPLYSIE